MRVLRLKRFFTYSSLTWLIAAIAVFCLVCLPLVQNAWAYCFWERVPCKVSYDADGNFWKFTFNFHNHGYNSTRVDFWDRRNTGTIRTVLVTDRSALNRTCYISPTNIDYAVLNLDAHKRFDRAVNSLSLSAFVICVATALTYVSRRRSRANQT